MESQTAINIQRVAQSLSTLLRNRGVGMVGIMLVELEMASASLSLVSPAPPGGHRRSRPPPRARGSNR
jgi:hypothetical protein